MADVSIDGTVVAVTARGMRSVVFATEAIGYWFYLDGDGIFGYSKTTDGGATWSAQVDADGAAATTTVAFDVWFDQWTPGDTGTLIHMWWFDVTNDVVRWRTMNTSGDVLGTVRTVLTGASAVAGRGAFVSGTKTRSGYLYCAFDLDAGAERGLHRSTDSGTTWSSNLSTTFVEATIDQCLLFPASNTGDNNDCWAVYQDADVDQLTLKLWDSSAGSATESANFCSVIENVTDLTGQMGFSGAVRHSDGHLIVAAVTDRDTATSDHRVFDITDTSTITEKTAITTDKDDHYHPAVFIDQVTNAIYVAYNGKRDGSEVMGTTTKVYYTKSTDGGATWSAGDTAYMEGAAGVVVQVWAPLMGARFYAGWRVGTTLLGNKVSSVLMPTGIAGVAAMVFGQGSSAMVGTGALAGVAAMTFGAGSSAMRGSGPLAGAAAMSITPTAMLDGIVLAAGTCAVSITGAAALAGAGSLAGPAAVTISPTATMAGSGALAGAAAAAFSAAPSLGGAGALAGAAAVTVGQAAAVTGSGSLAGAAALTFGQAGATTGAGSLAGACAVTVSQAASLPGSGALVGSASVSLTAQVVGLGAGALAGIAQITVSAAAMPELPSGGMAGAAQLGLSASATSVGQGRLVGTAQSQFACVGAGDVFGALSGLGSLSFTPQGVLLADGALAGTSVLQLLAAARMRASGLETEEVGTPRATEIDESGPGVARLTHYSADGDDDGVPRGTETVSDAPSSNARRP